MRDVYYIGGSPCSGKSSIAEMLEAEYGFAYYKLDDFLYPYMDRAAREGKECSARALSLDFEQMWMRDPQLQSDEEFAIYKDIFPYAIEAIGGMDPERAVIADGAGFTPELVASLHIEKNRYICIVPTEEFQRENFAKRTWIDQFLSGCKDPKAAFDHWMSRDGLFAKEALRQAKKLGYATIVVDGSRTIEEHYQMVVSTFGLSK